jgi:hypothetical protein
LPLVSPFLPFMIELPGTLVAVVLELLLAFRRFVFESALLQTGAHDSRDAAGSQATEQRNEEDRLGARSTRRGDQER